MRRPRNIFDVVWQVGKKKALQLALKNGAAHISEVRRQLQDAIVCRRQRLESDKAAEASKSQLKVQICEVHDMRNYDCIMSCRTRSNEEPYAIQV